MGKQHNKIIKRRRRRNYVKRKTELEKQSAALKGKPAADKKAPVKKAAAKKAPAKKAAAKKAPAKKAAAKKAPAKKAAKK